LRAAGLQDAVDALKRMQAPFLNWSGKAERQSFEVPTLPLFVHERLSTPVIVKTLEDHRRRPDQGEMDALFGDPRMPLSQQVDAYQHRNNWVNRLILGDSLVVMNSLLRFEGLGGKVQMIYIDPPYGVRFGSNFQPFVRKRDVTNNDDSGHDARAGDGAGVSRYLAVGAALVSDVSARSAAGGKGSADAERQCVRADRRREFASCAGGDGRGIWQFKFRLRDPR
jgi:hypothetical protein